MVFKNLKDNIFLCKFVIMILFTLSWIHLLIHNLCIILNHKFSNHNFYLIINLKALNLCVKYLLNEDIKDLLVFDKWNIRYAHQLIPLILIFKKNFLNFLIFNFIIYYYFLSIQLINLSLLKILLVLNIWLYASQFPLNLLLYKYH